MAADYLFTPVTTEENKLIEYVDLLNEVFNSKDHFSLEYLKWLYHENYFGKAVGYDAYYESKLIGHYVAVPVEYIFKGQVLKGLLSLNTATNKNHQGKGLFTKLATKTYDLAQELGYDFVIGVANQNSTHGFIKKLGFKLVGPLDAKLILGDFKVDSARSKDKFRANWTKESLNWRLCKPGSDYFLNKKSNIYSATDISFISASLLPNQVLNSTVCHDNRRKAMIKLYLGYGMEFTNRGVSLSIPRKLRPSPLNLIYKRLKSSLNDVELINNMVFNCIDFDAY